MSFQPQSRILFVVLRKTRGSNEFSCRYQQFFKLIDLFLMRSADGVSNERMSYFYSN